jgi:hypothetical protein
MLLELTDREFALLRETLTMVLKGLVAEIAHTDRREYRDLLRQRHTELDVVLRRMLQAEAVPLEIAAVG